MRHDRRSGGRRVRRDSARGKALLAKEYATMTAESNDNVYDIVSQIWPADPHMSEAQARATFDYLQPQGPSPVDFPKTFTNQFLSK